MIDLLDPVLLTKLLLYEYLIITIAFLIKKDYSMVYYFGGAALLTFGILKGRTP